MQQNSIGFTKRRILALAILLFAVPLFGQMNNTLQRYLRQGIAFYQQGDFESAYQNFRQYAVNGGPATPEFYLYWATSAAKSAHGDEVEILQRAITQFPQNVDLHLLLAQFLAEKQQFSEAMQVLKAVKETLPAEQYRRLMAGLAFNEGIRLYRKEQKQQSLTYFRQAVELWPNDARFIRNLAIVLWESGQKKQAQELLEKNLQRFPQDDDMYRLLITFYQKSGALDKLQKKLQARARQTDKLEDWLHLGRFYLLMGQEAKARALFKRLAEKYPAKKEVFLTAIDFYRSVFQYQAVDSVLDVMARHFPDDTLICVLKAQNYEALEQFDKAAESWQHCLQKVPQLARWHFNLLRDLWQVDSTRYYAHLTRMETLLPDRAVRLKIAMEWLQHRRFKRALPLLRSMAPGDSADGVILTLLGECYLNTGNDSLAFRYFNKALKAPGVLPQAYFGLAQLTRRRGQFKKADRYFEIGLELLLNRLKQEQGAMLTQLQKNLAKAQVTETEKIVDAYLDDEALFKRELRRFTAGHTPQESRAFLQKLLERFPKNVYLRLLLADIMIENKKYDQAKHYLDDALFMKPGYPPALRRKINLARLRGDDLALFRAYLNLLYHDRPHFSEQDYRNLLEIARKLGQLPNLAQQLLLLHERDRSDARLKQFTIESLHLVGQHQKARAVAAEKVQTFPASQLLYLPGLQGQK